MTRFGRPRGTRDEMGTDRLEGELRALLREDAPSSAPERLRQEAARIAREAAPEAPRSSRRAFVPLARSVAAMAIVIALVVVGILTMPRLTGPQPGSPNPSLGVPLPASTAPASARATTEPTPTPNSTQPPSPSSVANPPRVHGPTAVATGEEALGPDGTLYVASAPWGKDGRGQVTALDPSASVKPGWPFAPAGIVAFDGLAVASDGTIYVVGHVFGPGPVRVYALSPDGRVLPGWPWTAGVATGQSQVWSLGVGADGTLWAVTSAYGNEGGRSSSQLVALGRDAKVRAGFPIDLAGTPGCGGVSCHVIGGRVADDGTWYGMVSTGSGAVDGPFEIVAYRPDGSLVPGWPARAPGEGFALGPGGLVYAWGVETNGLEPPKGVPEIEKTIVTVLEPDGSVRSGWPVTITGAASPPLLGSDGTLYLTAGTPETSAQVLAYGLDGMLLPGWPVAVPPELHPWPYYVGEGGPARLSPPLTAGADGTAYLVVGRSIGDDDGLLPIDRAGRPRAPLWLPGGASVAQTAWGTPGTSELVPPAGHPDGSIEVAVITGTVTLGSDGRIVEDRSSILPASPRTSVVVGMLPAPSHGTYLITTSGVYSITR